MKLHLPKKLLSAVLSCGAAALSCGVAQAGYVWKTNVDDTVPAITCDPEVEDGTRDSWNNHANWNLTGGTTWPDASVTNNVGPGVTNSNAWEPIIINNGADGTVRDLEGWTLNLTVENGSNLTIDNLKKMQGGTKFAVGDNSSLTINFKKSSPGSDEGAVNITLTDSGALTMNLFQDKGANNDARKNEITTVDYGEVSASDTIANALTPRGVFTLNGKQRVGETISDHTRTYYNKLILKADIGRTTSETETTTLHTLKLASISNVNVSSPIYDIGGDFQNSGKTTALDGTNDDIGLYSIVESVQDNVKTYTLYYVTGNASNAKKLLPLTEGGTQSLSLLNYGSAFGGTLTVEITKTEDVSDDKAHLSVDQNFALGTLAATGGALSVDVTADRTLELGHIDSSNGASVAFTGSGTLRKTGSGELTDLNLSGFTGTLAVGHGTVKFKNNEAWTGSINVESFGTLAFASGEKTLSDNVTIANGAHIKTQDSVTLTLEKAIANGSTPVFNIAEGTTLKVKGNGTLGGSKLEGAGTLRFEKTGEIRSTGNTFTGTLDIASGEFRLGAIEGNNGRGDGDIKATKVLVHKGATFITNNGQTNDPAPTGFDNMGATINSTFYAQTGSTLKNMDGHSKWGGTIHLNVNDLGTTTGDPGYNASGSMTMSMYWAKYVVWDALVEGDGTLNIKGGDRDTGKTHCLVLNNNDNTFKGTYCLEGNGAGDNTYKMELYLNKANAAQNAIIDIKATDAASDSDDMTNLLVGVDATIAGLKGTAKGAVKADGGAHTLTINQSTDTGFAGAIKNGDAAAEVLGITKKGDGTLTLSGANTYTGATAVTDGTLKVTGSGSIGSTSSVAVSGDGVLEISGESASVTAGGITATANRAEGGTAKKVTIDSSGIRGTTSGEGDASVQELGEMMSMTLDFAAVNTAATISNVTMRDVTLSGGNLTLSGSVVAIASAAPAEAVSPVRMMALSADADAGSADTQTLTATTVKSGGSISGTLTVDIDGSVLSPDNAGKKLTWTILDSVSLEDGETFTLELGDVLTSIVGNGQPVVELSGSWVNNDDHFLKLSADDLGNLSTGNLLTASGNSGNLVLTVKNLPEPTTGTLSVLALAALAARRRRRK